MIKIIRQGDVVIFLSKEKPDSAKKREDRTLAYGEVTGHHHTLQQDTAVVYGELEGVQWIVVEEDTDLTHQEHDTLAIPPGTQEVLVQREYHPEEIRRVVD